MNTIELKVINGDNIELLKGFPDNYFDAVVTDPPYGLGKEPNALELMKDWVEHGYHQIKGSGFMGKEWDAFVPQPIFWKEVFRVLKHGGHVVSFFGTRTYDWGVMAMRFAGFEVRDCIQWLYGSGFPKSHNISKALDGILGKQGKGFKSAGDDGRKSEFKQDLSKRSDYGYVYIPTNEDAKKWDGWGTALKPSVEPIVLARKPLEKGLSIVENVLKWGTGGINIDGCRVEGAKPDCKNIPIESWRIMEGRTDIPETTPQVYDSKQGRFPSNTILSHHYECECKGLKKVKGSSCSPEDVGKGRDGDFSNGIYGAKSSKITVSHTDENGEETVEDWDCHEDCPIRIIDMQSGVGKSVKSKRGNGIGKGFHGSNSEHDTERGHSDSGGASRFFKHCNYSEQEKTYRFLYSAKASKSERNKGLDGFEEKISGSLIGTKNKTLKTGSNNERNNMNLNFHPTVKPVELMKYLVRLITPPNGIVLDPFCGSGTTGIACKLEGFNFVGMEQDAEYSKIAESRINNYKEEKEKPLTIIEQPAKEDSKSNKLNQGKLF